jgi:hypothetical protein
VIIYAETKPIHGVKIRGVTRCGSVAQLAVTADPVRYTCIG